MGQRDKDEPLKSAVELAMERLREKDRIEGGEAPRVLSEAQKEAIAEIRARYEARVAESGILHADSLRKAAERGDQEALAKLEEDHRQQLAELDRKREEEIEAVRAGT